MRDSYGHEEAGRWRYPCGQGLPHELQGKESGSNPLLFQSRYLTIQGYEDRYGEYCLGIPNLEVREGLLGGLLSECTSGASTQGGTGVSDLRRCLGEGDTDGVRDILDALFASTPYASGKAGRDPFEHYFQAILCDIFLLLSIQVTVETHVAHGRMDVCIECRRHVYVMELKRDGTAAEALAQVEDRGYDKRYVSDPRRLHRVGCSFDSATLLLADWAVAWQGFHRDPVRGLAMASD